MDWLHILAAQGTLKSLLQQHSSKASILQGSAFLIVQLSHPYRTTGITIALIIWAFIDKVTSLLLSTLSMFVVAFLPSSNFLSISWLQSPSAVILEPPPKIKSATVSTVSPSICHEVGPDAIEKLLLNQAKTLGFLASGGEEFNLGPETRLDHSELLCNE